LGSRHRTIVHEIFASTSGIGIQALLAISSEA
jgi:hypothetical protein